MGIPRLLIAYTFDQGAQLLHPQSINTEETLCARRSPPMKSFRIPSQISD
jgi:hypothetical protein